MIRPCLLATAIGLFSVGHLQASVQVRFVEGAPQDRFILKNVGTCDVISATLSIDLSPSVGRLIFDVTKAGAGVEVFQPLELVEGADALFKLPSVAGGQDYIDLEIDLLASVTTSPSPSMSTTPLANAKSPSTGPRSRAPSCPTLVTPGTAPQCSPLMHWPT